MSDAPPDLWAEKERVIRNLVNVKKTGLNVFGEPDTTPKHNCDDISKWMGAESCRTCPNPCPEKVEATPVDWSDDSPADEE
jgi:hypothetical protein